MEILGQVYGFGHEDAGNYTGVESIQFKVGLTAGGSPVDFSMTTLTLSTDEEVYKLDRHGTSKVAKGDIDYQEWGVVEIFNSDAEDLLLENQEQFVILAKTKEDDWLVANQPFNLEIRPSVGASYAISRKITPSISAVNVLN